jgi:hypothetical protein
MQWEGSSVRVGVVIHGCGGGSDDMIRADNNFKLNSSANKTIEKLNIGCSRWSSFFSRL